MFFLIKSPSTVSSGRSSNATWSREISRFFLQFFHPGGIGGHGLGDIFEHAGIGFGLFRIRRLFEKVDQLGVDRRQQRPDDEIVRVQVIGLKDFIKNNGRPKADWVEPSGSSSSILLPAAL